MLHRGDAVGRHAFALRDEATGRGIPSRIYIETPAAETEGEASHYSAYESEARPGDLLVYQFATASGLADWLVERAERLVVNYHSVTPPEHFAPWDNSLALH